METVTAPGTGDAKHFESTADRLLSKREFASASEAYLQAADQYELPPAEICTKLARALMETKRPSEACEWALKVVDTGNSFKAWSTAARIFKRCGREAIPRVRRTLHVGIVGTWTTNAFVPLFQLAAARLGIWATVYEAGFGQYFNETLNPASTLVQENIDALLLCPEQRTSAIPSFSENPEEAINKEVERWSTPWEQLRTGSTLSIIQHGFVLSDSDPFGHYGSGLAGSRKRVAAEVNARLAKLAHERDIGFVDADGLAARFGKSRWFDDRNWHMAKIPYAMETLPVLARHTAAVLAAKLGLSRRCLVLDLDNTLWGGVVGDDGVDGLTLGNGVEGEAFVDFQYAIKELVDRGIVLAVCSKNELDIAKRPFETHPEMVLKLDDIAVFTANWESKSKNLQAISEQLNLGLDALTFFDDNAYERAEVRRALPAVDVPVLPSDPVNFRRALQDYPYFEAASFTKEDRARSEQYRARAKAEQLRSATGTLESYQASLGMVATVGAIDSPNMARVVQLINKTNQFNLTTKRRDRAELEQLLAQPDVEHFWVRLHDKFADHGLIAVAIAVAKQHRLEIDTMLMSCRVIGRDVERLMIQELITAAQRRGCQIVLGRYVRTPRNAMVSELFPRLGFVDPNRVSSDETTWTMPVTAPFSGCPFIAVERSDRDNKPVRRETWTSISG